MNTIERYNENPTVISMDRNMFFWNTSFPSLTICPHKKLNELKLNQYMEWALFCDKFLFFIRDLSPKTEIIHQSFLHKS